MKVLNLGSALAAIAAVSASATSSASFVGYFVSSYNTSSGGHALVVYTLTARFNGPYDTVFSAFDLASEDPNALTGFWHKDNHGDPATNGILSQRYGTWDPTTTGSATANRPFDSYLTIGGIARPANTTRANSQWFDGGNPETRGWSRPDLPANGMIGWTNSDSDNGQGTVGNSAGVPTTDVRLAQFVLSEGEYARAFTICIKYGNEYSLSDDYQVVSGSFTLGTVPGPGPVALLAIGGLFARRRR